MNEIGPTFTEFKFWLEKHIIIQYIHRVSVCNRFHEGRKSSDVIKSNHSKEGPLQMEK